MRPAARAEGVTARRAPKPDRPDRWGWAAARAPAVEAQSPAQAARTMPASTGATPAWEAPMALAARAARSAGRERWRRRWLVRGRGGPAERADLCGDRVTHRRRAEPCLPASIPSRDSPLVEAHGVTEGANCASAGGMVVNILGRSPCNPETPSQLHQLSESGRGRRIPRRHGPGRRNVRRDLVVPLRSRRSLRRYDVRRRSLFGGLVLPPASHRCEWRPDLVRGGQVLPVSLLPDRLVLHSRRDHRAAVEGRIERHLHPRPGRDDPRRRGRRCHQCVAAGKGRSQPVATPGHWESDLGQISDPGPSTR